MSKTSLRQFQVEIETEPLSNYTLPITLAVDRVSQSLARLKDGGGTSVGGTAERSLSIQIIVGASDAAVAVQEVITAIQKACQKHDLGALLIRKLSVAPETDHQLREDAMSSAQYESHQTNSSPMNIARLLSGVHVLVRELRTSGHDEVARTLEPYLRPGVPTHDLLNGLRHHLVEIRSTELGVLYSMERRLDDLILLAQSALGSLFPRS